MSDPADQSTVFDVGRQQVGAVYAKALLNAALPKGMGAQIAEELESLIKDVFEPLPQLEAVLYSPRIDPEDKERILHTAFHGRMTPMLLDGLKVIARHERLDCLREISSSARVQVNESLQIVTVRVTTADSVDETLLSQIGKALNSALETEVDLQSEIDTNLIGGLVVHVGDTVYDGSVSGKLDRLREKTLNQTTEHFRGAIDKYAQGE